MTETSGDLPTTLPERSRLLYIGPMKTGTSALQTAARDRRQTLLDHGVRYPGSRLNHRTELGALLGISTMTRRRTGPLGPESFDSSGIPDMSRWESLRDELDAETERRILVTHEFVSQADDTASQRVIDALGSQRLHVAITVRAPSAILPSFWAQNVKAAAEPESFDGWLHRLYDPQQQNPLPDWFHRGYDQGELVERWAHLLGPENITVIVVDRTQQTLLTDTFEALLDLPTGMLARGQDTNRALSAPEAAMFQRLNQSLNDNDVDWRTYHNLVTKGSVFQGLFDRAAVSDEPRLQLPEWANEAAQWDGKRFAERIRASGVRVVGNLDSLGAAAPARKEIDEEHAPTDIAVHAITGAVLAGQQEHQAAQRRIDKFEKRAAKFEQRANAAREKNQQLKNERAALKKQLKRERNRSLHSRVRALPRHQRIQHAATTHTNRELLAALRRRGIGALRTTGSRLLRRVLGSSR